MLTNSSLSLNLSMLPEVKDFSNLKPCDILNSGKLSEPEISDSVSLCLMLSDWLLTSALELFGQIPVTARHVYGALVSYLQYNR